LELDKRHQSLKVNKSRCDPDKAEEDIIVSAVDVEIREIKHESTP